MHLLRLLAVSLAAVMAAAVSPTNRTYTNPNLPGWHSDPSCIRTPDGIFLCVASTFIAFPGLPVYASRDLLTWRLASHVWNRESQLPGISRASPRQMGGMYAATIRLHRGTYYVICEYLDGGTPGILGVIFTTTDPFSDSAWSDNPVHFSTDRIDPDLFWDDDGKVYMATYGVVLQELDLATGRLSQPPLPLWNGTGGVWPEGPHVYKKDGWYYLLIAEGGTGTDHAVTMARARSIEGPYEASPHNPHLTNRGTDEYFQTVGHADLFQDGEGNWWGMCLATRSGRAYRNYPMGRESVLFPVTWEEGEWPVMEPVRGRMEGPLPVVDDPRDLPGSGPFVGEPQDVDFTTGDAVIPVNFLYWRVPREETFSVTPGRGLKIVPTRSNLTGVVGSDVTLNGQSGLGFVGHRQTHSLFTFSVELSFDPQGDGHEAGVSAFLTQYNHIDLAIVREPSSGVRSLRLRTVGMSVGIEPPAPVTRAFPESWDGVDGPIRLEIKARNLTHYEFSAAPVADPERAVLVGVVSSRYVSGGEGPFTGTLLGAYATCNGKGSGDECPAGDESAAFVSRWKYTGDGQHITETEVVPGNVSV